MSLDADDGAPKTVRYDFTLRDGWTALDLPQVAPQEAAKPLHYMQGLAAESDQRDRSIHLDISISLFMQIARYLLTRLPPPRITFAPEEWLPFVRACDYLGLGHLPAALTDSADVAFLSALTRADARVALRERRVLEIYSGRREPGDLDIATLLDDKFRAHPCIGGCSGACGTPRLVDEIMGVLPGDLIKRLTADYVENWADLDRALGCADSYPRIGGNSRNIQWRSEIVLDDLRGFPWVAAGDRVGARIVLAGAAVLRGLTVASPHWLHRYYGRPKYDLHIVSQSPSDAMEALIRTNAWISRITGSQFMMARLESAVLFITAYGLYSLSTELYSSVEHLLCSLRVAPLAFDGAHVFVTERGECEMRLQRVIADPGRHTAPQLATMLARGFDVAVPGLGPQAEAALGQRLRYRTAQHASSMARTVIEQLYARRQLGFRPAKSDYSQFDCVPFGDLRVQTLRQFILQVRHRIAAGTYRPQMFTRNLAYIMHPCDAALAEKRADDPDLPYVPRGVQPRPLTFGLKRLAPTRVTASGWFPDESHAAESLKKLA